MAGSQVHDATDRFGLFITVDLLLHELLHVPGLADLLRLSLTRCFVSRLGSSRFGALELGSSAGRQLLLELLLLYSRSDLRREPLAAALRLECEHLMAAERASALVPGSPLVRPRGDDGPELLALAQARVPAVIVNLVTLGSPYPVPGTFTVTSCS